jgi:MauM/NapG family ferredoxin protein
MRLGIQLALAALFVFLVFANVYPHGFRFPVDLFMRIDPYSALTVMLASRDWIWHLAPSLAVLASALVVGRAFCGWVCPLGTALDCWGGLLRLRSKPGRPRRIANLKYYILAGTLAAAVLGSTAVHFFDPMTIAERSGIFVVRQAVSAVVRAGGDWAGAAGPSFEDRFYGLSFVFALFLAGILALEALNRRFWCRYLCPLGAALSVVGRVSRIVRQVKGCESTDICKRACVFGVVGDDPTATRSGECTLCLRCRRACPHGAISFGRKPLGDPAGESVSLGRRAFAGAVLAGLVYAAIPGGRTLSRRPRTRPIRPPGARPETEFLAACTRCGACIGACLTGGLQPALFEAGIEGIWTPLLVGRLGGCEAECNLCGKVCNTQAIRYMPLDEKKKTKVGKAVIDRGLCLAWKEERVCYICDEVCPFGAIDIKREPGAIGKPAVDPAKCTGCGLCEWKCPVRQPAIYVMPLDEEAA